MARFSIVGRRVRETAYTVIATQAALDATFDGLLAAAERDPQWVTVYIHDANGTTAAARYFEIRRGALVE